MSIFAVAYVSPELDEIMGIHIGDGCMSRNKRYSEYYLGGHITEEKEYHDFWIARLYNQHVLEPFFDLRAPYKEHPKLGIYGFHIFNETLVQFFEALGVLVGPKTTIGIPAIVFADTVCCRRFVRGIFDTDGNLYFSKNYSAKHTRHINPVLSAASTSKLLARQVETILPQDGLHPRIQSPLSGKRTKNPYFKLILYRRADISIYRFMKLCGLKNSKHTTKWKYYLAHGHCPPHTTLKQRVAALHSGEHL